jgi:hypothetical protein
MALVEVAQFLDRNEAYIARAALVSAGLYADVRDNSYANLMFGMAIATGGYAVLVDDAEAAEAAAILAEADPGSPEALDWTEHPQHLTGIPMAALGAATALATGAEASMLLGLKRRVTPLNLLLAAVPVAALVLFLIVVLG